MLGHVSSEIGWTECHNGRLVTLIPRGATKAAGTPAPDVIRVRRGAFYSSRCLLPLQGTKKVPIG